MTGVATVHLGSEQFSSAPRLASFLWNSASTRSLPLLAHEKTIVD
jgi:hypothetical protein